MKPKSKIFPKAIVVLLMVLIGFNVLSPALVLSQSSTSTPSYIYDLQERINKKDAKCMELFARNPTEAQNCKKELNALRAELDNALQKIEGCAWWNVGCHILSRLISILNKGLAWILNIFLRIAGVLMQVAAYLFDEILKVNLDPSTFDPNSNVYGGGFVHDGWTKLRDLANLIFIFFLLAIAIATILGWETYGIKKALLTLIIMAVLINFSLMFSRYIIELPNTLAEYLYKNNIEKIGQEFKTTSASALILQGLNPQQIYNTAKEIGEGGDIAVTEKIIIGTILGIFVVLGIALAFFSAAVLLIMRVVTLWFLMILSPVAFLMFAFPATQGYGRTWLNWLFNQAFFLPVLVFFLYIGINFALKINASPGFSEIQAFNPGRPETFTTFSLKYLLVLFMFSTAVWLAKSMAGKSGEIILSRGESARRRAGKIIEGEGKGMQRLGEKVGGRVKELGKGRGRIIGAISSGVGRAMQYPGKLVSLYGQAISYGAKKKKKGGGGEGGGGGGGGSEEAEREEEGGEEEGRGERTKPGGSYIEAGVRLGGGIIGRIRDKIRGRKRAAGEQPRTGGGEYDVDKEEWEKRK